MSTTGPRASRVADAHLAYDEPGRSPYGYDPGHVEPFEPTVGEGSQVPPAHDHQGKPVEPPDLGTLEVPGYEWHDTSKAFHQVVVKNAKGEPMKLGVDVRSFTERKNSWWFDLVALVREYWSFQQVDVRFGLGRVSFTVEMNGPRSIEVRGPLTAPTVFVGGTSRRFAADDSLWDILMWIDATCRTKLGSEAEVPKVAAYDANVYKTMEKAHAMIKDAYPDVDDETILGVVGPWFAGKLFHTQIPKKPFASDGGRRVLRILTTI
jgi:hypothetical protein